MMFQPIDTTHVLELSVYPVTNRVLQHSSVLPDIFTTYAFKLFRFCFSLIFTHYIEISTFTSSFGHKKVRSMIPITVQLDHLINFFQTNHILRERHKFKVLCTTVFLYMGQLSKLRMIYNIYHNYS